MADIQVHLIISGRVQGVFYRYSTQREATRFGLTGWVKNLRNGDVEAVIEGEEGLVEEMIKWCWQGPPGARIQDIKIERKPSTGDFSDFLIDY